MASKLRVLEDPVEVAYGEEISFAVEVEGVESITGTPVITAYRGSTDVTSDVFPGGSVAVTGNIITLKPIVPGTKYRGQNIVANIVFAADGNTEVRTINFYVIDEREP